MLEGFSLLIDSLAIPVHSQLSLVSKMLTLGAHWWIQSPQACLPHLGLMPAALPVTLRIYSVDADLQG